MVIAASSALAAYEAVTRLAHPRPVSNLLAVAIAAVLGFTGNELVARYRLQVGRKIGSAALVTDGLHARTDGFTSLAVLLGVGGVALGWDLADPVVGLVITVAILAVHSDQSVPYFSLHCSSRAEILASLGVGLGRGSVQDHERRSAILGESSQILRTGILRSEARAWLLRKQRTTVRACWIDC